MIFNKMFIHTNTQKHMHTHTHTKSKSKPVKSGIKIVNRKS